MTTPCTATLTIGRSNRLPGTGISEANRRCAMQHSGLCPSLVEERSLDYGVLKVE
jgi:hypothetical protein